MRILASQNIHDEASVPSKDRTLRKMRQEQLDLLSRIEKIVVEDKADLIPQNNMRTLSPSVLTKSIFNRD
jgi:hypothetical protein